MDGPDDESQNEFGCPYTGLVCVDFDFAVFLFLLPARTIHPAIFTIQPSISPVPGIILYQSLNLCYLLTRLAGSTLHFMRPRRGVPKNPPLPVYPELRRACPACPELRGVPHNAPLLFALFAPRYLLYFLAIPHCPFCNPFVLITIQIAGGGGYPWRYQNESEH